MVRVGQEHLPSTRGKRISQGRVPLELIPTLRPEGAEVASIKRQIYGQPSRVGPIATSSYQTLAAGS